MTILYTGGIHYLALSLEPAPEGVIYMISIAHWCKTEINSARALCIGTFFGCSYDKASPKGT